MIGFLFYDLVISVGIVYFYYYIIDKKTIWALPLIALALFGIMTLLSILSIGEPTLTAKVSRYFSSERSVIIPYVYIPSFIIILFASLQLLCKD